MNEWKLYPISMGEKKGDNNAYQGWRVVGKNGLGKPIRKAFRDRAKAEEFLQQCVAFEAAGDPYEAGVVRFSRMTFLTDQQIAFCEQAITMFSGIEEIQYKFVDPQLILTATEFYLAHKAKAASKVRKSIEDAVTEFLEEKRKDGCREAYLKPLEYRLKLFARSIGQTRQVNEVSNEQVEEHLYKTTNIVTRNSLRGNLAAFFNWSKTKGLIAESPVGKAKVIKVAAKEPVILALDNVKEILKFSATHRNGIALAYTVLNIFCGLRREESHKLTWSNIDLEAGHIKVDATVTKMKRRRVSEIPTNAVAWLKICDRECSINPGRRAEDNIKRAGGFHVDSGGCQNDHNLPPWPADGLRHTCLSYRLALTQDAAGAAHWAGNSEDVLLTRYFGLATKQQTEEFWAITPQSLGIILPPVHLGCKTEARTGL